jgi:hypothetical protein
VRRASTMGGRITSLLNEFNINPSKNRDSNITFNNNLIKVIENQNEI